MSTLLDKVARIEARYDELSDLLAQPDVASNPELLQRYGREQSTLAEIVTTYRDLRRITAELAETELALADGLDEAMQDLFREELRVLREREVEYTEQLRPASSRQSSFACTPVTRSAIAGRSSWTTPTRTPPAASKKSSARSMAAAR